MYKKIFHIVNISIMIVMVSAMEALGKLGLSALGTCSVISLSYISFLPIIGYLILSMYTLFYIKKRLKVASNAQKVKNQMFSQYRTYIYCTVIIWSVIAFAWAYNYQLTESCNKKQSCIDKYENWTGVINALGNIAKVCSSIVLTYYGRYKDPFLH